MKLFSLLLFLLVFLYPQQSLARQVYAASKISKVIQSARKQSGCHYSWGGNYCKKGFDCSGLMQHSFKVAGINIPRNSRAQANHWRGKDVALQNLQPGDLIFFAMNRKNFINHVGLITYTRNSRVKFIHASSNHGRVEEERLKGVWRSSFNKGKRLFKTINHAKPTLNIITHGNYWGKYPQASLRKLKKIEQGFSFR